MGLLFAISPILVVSFGALLLMLVEAFSGGGKKNGDIALGTAVTLFAGAAFSIAAWMIGAVRTAAERAGRDPAAVKFCVAAPAYVGDDLALKCLCHRHRVGADGAQHTGHAADHRRVFGDDDDAQSGGR